MIRLLKSSPAWLQVALLTAVFGALYPLLRALPDTRCTFLHHDTVGQSVDGSLICGNDEPATFLDLGALQFPVTLQLETFGEAVIGQRLDCVLWFENASGDRIYPGDLAVVHTEKIHLLVVDPTLEDYHHIHPEPMGPTGQYSFSVTPRRGGTYRVYADIVPVASRSQVVCLDEIEVAGSGSPPPELRYDTEAEVAGIRFAIDTPVDGFVVGRQNDFRLRVERAGGDPVRLGEIMGTFAHAVAFDFDHHGFAHLHPLGASAGVEAGRPSIALAFATHRAGNYRLWAQVLVDGEELFAPFDIAVRSPSL